MSIQYGFFDDLSYEQYCAIPALRCSELKLMQRSPLHYRWHMDNPRVETDAMKLGTVTHRTILEPDLLDTVAVWTGGVRSGKEWDSFCFEHRDKQILTVTERDWVAGIVAAVRKHKAASKYLGRGRSEVTMVWHDKAAKRDMKARLDRPAFIDGVDTIVDLKTTRDSRPLKFGGDAYRLGYHMQFAFYQDGYHYLTGKMPRVAVVAAENKPPFETAVYMVPEDVLSQGSDDYRALLKQLMECEAKNEWPPALETETELSLPSYAYGEAVDDLSDLELVM